jgi:hypothetical protein
MSSIDYKLSGAEKNDLISSCIIKGSQQYRLSEINPLPYGYLFCFKDEQGYSNSFVVNILDSGAEVDVAPNCDFASKIKKFLEDYFNEMSKT